MPGLSGWVRFFQEWDRVLVVADVSGLPEDGGAGSSRCTSMKAAVVAGKGFLRREDIMIRRAGPIRSMPGIFRRCCGVAGGRIWRYGRIGSGWRRSSVGRW